MAASNHIKIKLREVNRHLVCRLCRGYYVDATTIAECLHSFCRSCIIKYLEKNSFCPICEVQIHKTKPYLNLRLDKALQDVVYKVVPGLYHNEMRRRREFYARRQEQIPFATPEQCGVEERIIFSPEDSISLSLEYFESDDFESETVSSQSSESGDNPDILSFPQQLGLMKLKNNDGKISRRESQDVQETCYFPKRYLQCPAVVNVGHLKKFIRMKHELTDKMQVSVIHKRVPLPDHYTLMDVAYIFTWKRSAPLRFFYQIYQTKKHKLKVPPAPNEAKEAKSLCTTEELELEKNTTSDKNSDGDLAKSLSEANKNIKVNDDKNETVVSEIKETVHNNILKNVDSNKPVAETKSEISVKSEPSVNGVSGETKEGFETTCNTDSKTPNNNKCEKPKSNGVITTENKNKIECQKRKSVKVENNLCSAREVKENDFKNNERVLLNPISGQLESVPSTDQHKSNVNGAITSAEKKEIGETPKKEGSNKSQKKTESQNSKDSKKSSVNLLKSFRKEKLSAAKGDGKVDSKNSRGNSLTITAISKNEKPSEKEAEKFRVEIKSNKESEYDFDGSSPPSKIIPLQEFSKYSKYSKFMAEHRHKWLSKESKDKWMSLQDFREKMLKENESDQEEAFKKTKKKVPYLYKINSEKNKTPSVKKTHNGKLLNEKPSGNKTPPTVINIKTECEDSKVEVTPSKRNSPLQPVKIENKDGEYSVKPVKVKKSSSESICDIKSKSESVERLASKADDGNKPNGLTKEHVKRNKSEKTESENSKSITKSDKAKSDTTGVIDLSKTDTTPKSKKHPLENSKDMANKKSSSKNEEKMIKALMSAAQKQSIEPLLKIPQYSQMVKNSVSQGSPSPGKNISSNEISQALQFLEELRSDIKVLEAKNQLNPNSVLEQFTQKSGNLEPYQQLYQQKIDLIRRLKRHQQIMPGDPDASPKKQLKLSPSSESKKNLSPSSEQKAKTSPVSDEIAQSKANLDRTLSQIQLMELQIRMLTAHNYKNLPALLQCSNRSPIFCPGQTSPSKSNQQKIKSSSHSPIKSPQSLSSSSGNSPLSATNSDSFFNAQSYNHLINAGLNSEMTYHQMFQSYLNQQEQMNQDFMPFRKACESGPIPHIPKPYSIKRIRKRKTGRTINGNNLARKWRSQDLCPGAYVYPLHPLGRLRSRIRRRRNAYLEKKLHNHQDNPEGQRKM